MIAAHSNTVDAASREAIMRTLIREQRVRQLVG